MLSQSFSCRESFPEGPVALTWYTREYHSMRFIMDCRTRLQSQYMSWRRTRVCWREGQAKGGCYPDWDVDRIRCVFHPSFLIGSCSIFTEFDAMEYGIGNERNWRNRRCLMDSTRKEGRRG
jgi:hypothetical protein